MNTMTRRNLIKSAAAASAAGLVPGLSTAVYAQGSDKPEKEEVRIGFIPLTDCASVVMASVLGFDKKYGVKIIPTKEASWAGVRDKLVNGELDMAHVQYGLVYGVHLGIGGPKKDMAVEMLTGGVGIGFWVWDEWNNLNVKHILIAILVIGVVGLLLEMLLVNIARRFSFDEV